MAQVKSGLAPTGVLRQNLATTQQFQLLNIRPHYVKNKLSITPNGDETG
jgi:hypothetical protein